MHASDPLLLAVIYLVAMVAAVPLARKLGLGTVLGYLLAGVVLGRSALGLLGHEQEGVLHIAEFGVIMMLFLIGLELRPTVLWKMRGPIFGLGGLQVGATAAAFLALGLLAGGHWKPALAAGLILSLSSTAIVLQTLQEKGALKTTGGESSFAVLLFQDIAVIPMLALFPLLAAKQAEQAAAASGPAPWVYAIQVLGAVSLVVVTGKYLIQPVFRMVGNSRLRELFTAMALLLVLAITLLMNAVGLSPALGAFLAGVVLAESDYRHQLETDIEPFKGLLLGVFFISVGAGIDFGQIRAAPGFVALTVVAILAVKWLVLYWAGCAGKLARPDRLLLAFSLAQGGEFAFVLINFALGQGIFEAPVAQALTASVAISMCFAPAMIQLYITRIQPRFSGLKGAREADSIDESENPVIVAGFGRFGQMVTRLLRASGKSATILDYDAEQVEVIRNFGFRVYYGDASNMDLLRSAGAARARLLIVAIDDKDKALEIIRYAKQEFPHLRILARAYDRLHAYEMIYEGIEHPFIETAGSALQLGIHALRALGMPAHQALRAAQAFNRHNDESIRHLAKAYKELDEDAYMTQARNWLIALEGVMSEDASGVKRETDRGWEAAARAGASEL